MAKKLAMALSVFVVVLLVAPLAVVFTQGLSYDAVWTSPDWAWVAPVAAFVFAAVVFIAKRG